MVFRNDIEQRQALDLVCDSEGEIDIVTEVSPADAARVQASAYAKLVTIHSHRVVVGIFNRDAPDLPLNDQRARLALNLAVDRDALAAKSYWGWASPLAGLSPYSAVSLMHRTTPYAHDAAQARELWQAAGGTTGRALRVAAPEELEAVAWQMAAQISDALGIQTELTIYRGADKLELRRALASKQQPRPWDLLVYAQSGQSIDAPPLEMHRAFVGETGEFRAGPVLPAFEALYQKLVEQTSPLAQVEASWHIDRYVHDEALVLSLCSPQALYAVNKHVDFVPYSTTFELARCKVDAQHWSRRATK